MLNIEGYLKKPHVYEKHRDLLLLLNRFLIQKGETLNIRMSKNERAYQIWNDEKILDNAVCKSIVKWNHLETVLNYYLTPEPFFDYIHTKKEEMNILVIENKDTWYTMRKLMNKWQTDCFVAGLQIHGLVYGEGNKITKKNALADYENQIIQKKCHFFYWGDLDYTGIEMFQRVVRQNPAVSIRLFSNLYEKMLDAKPIEALGKIKHNQNQKINCELFLECFTPAYQEKIKLILKQNFYIPQEIMNAGCLKEVFEKG